MLLVGPCITDAKIDFKQFDCAFDRMMHILAKYVGDKIKQLDITGLQLNKNVQKLLKPILLRIENLKWTRTVCEEDAEIDSPLSYPNLKFF